MEIKKCCKCHEEKNIDSFTKQKTSKDGFYCVCKDCKKKYDDAYRKQNKSKISLIKKSHYFNNKKKILDNNRKYTLTNKEPIKSYQKKYRDENKEKHKNYQKKYRERNKKTRNLKEKNRKSIDVLYKLKTHMRTMLSNSFRRKGYTKKSKTFNILGCSHEEFKLYLESKFESWMNWDNRGLYNGQPDYGWDIDHIIPLDTAKSEEDVIRLNHYCNLQPLCSYYNRDIKIKNIDHSKYIHELIKTGLIK